MSAIYYHRNIIFKMSVTGILLSISILFLYFSHTFLTWPIFYQIGLKVDLSTLFILPIFMLAGWELGWIALIIRFLLGPFIIPMPLHIGYFSHFVFLLASIFFIFIFLGLDFLLNNIFNKRNKTNQENNIVMKKTKIKRRHINLAISLFGTTLLTSFIMTLLNGLFISPVFFNLYGVSNSNSFLYVQNQWSNISKIMFKSDNFSYWAFVFVLYFPFNLVNFSISSILAMPLYFVIKIFQKRNGF